MKGVRLQDACEPTVSTSLRIRRTIEEEVLKADWTVYSSFEKEESEAFAKQLTGGVGWVTWTGTGTEAMQWALGLALRGQDRPNRIHLPSPSWPRLSTLVRDYGREPAFYWPNVGSFEECGVRPGDVLIGLEPENPLGFRRGVAPWVNMRCEYPIVDVTYLEYFGRSQLHRFFRDLSRRSWNGHCVLSLGKGWGVTAWGVGAVVHIGCACGSPNVNAYASAGLTSLQAQVLGVLFSEEGEAAQRLRVHATQRLTTEVAKALRRLTPRILWIGCANFVSGVKVEQTYPGLMQVLADSGVAMRYVEKRDLLRVRACAKSRDSVKILQEEGLY